MAVFSKGKAGNILSRFVFLSRIHFLFIVPCSFPGLFQAFAKHTLHFIGLLSDGGVHSRFDQLVHMLQGAVRDGARRIRMHILFDGRDVPDGSSVLFTAQLEDVLAQLRGQGCDAMIASGSLLFCLFLAFVSLLIP